MRILALLSFLGFVGLVAGGRYYYVCEIKGMCDPQEVPDAYDARSDVRERTLVLRDADTMLLDGYDEFAFDSAQLSPRLNPNNTAFLDTLASLMRADTSRQLALMGRYRPGESDLQTGFFENMGLARADTVRLLLQDRGIDPNRITLDHELGDDRLGQPLAFSFYRPEVATEDEDFEKLSFTFTNMTFSDANFAFDSDVFDPGEPFRMYADSVKTYLELNPAKNLTIIGHTDDRGTDAYNLDLGLRRARSARDYFQELGVGNDIEVMSEGESRPAATNKTDEGRQKNRRVNFVLE